MVSIIKCRTRALEFNSRVKSLSSIEVSIKKFLVTASRLEVRVTPVSSERFQLPSNKSNRIYPYKPSIEWRQIKSNPSIHRIHLSHLSNEDKGKERAFSISPAQMVNLRKDWPPSSIVRRYYLGLYCHYRWLENWQRHEVKILFYAQFTYVGTYWSLGPNEETCQRL